jgi:cytochrome c553
MTMTSRTVARAMLLAVLVLTASAAHAQGFDPGKVDWAALSKIPMKDLFIKKFNEQCGSCHGEDLRGTPLGKPLVGIELLRGDSVKEIAQSIASGAPDKGMPAWSETLDEKQIWNLALYVAEQRQGTTILDKRDAIPLAIPGGVVRTEKHGFRIEAVAEGLDPMPFSIALLPDGRILLAERMRGLSIIGTDGRKSAPIRGTPPVYDDSSVFLGQVMGLGWMLDVALHPQYAKNGWIYIHHTDRCTDCNALSRKTRRPVSMNRIIRGRIRDGEWGGSAGHLAGGQGDLYRYLRSHRRRAPGLRRTRQRVLHGWHEGAARVHGHPGTRSALRQGASPAR